MHKRQARSFQRRYKVHEIDTAAIDRAVEDDFIPTAANMSLSEVESERAQLLVELTKCEQRLSIAKRQGKSAEVQFIGTQKAGLCSRISAINLRRAQLSREHSSQAMYQAVKELAPEELRQRIYARQAEIVEELRLGTPTPSPQGEAS